MQRDGRGDSCDLPGRHVADVTPVLHGLLGEADDRFRDGPSTWHQDAHLEVDAVVSIVRRGLQSCRPPGHGVRNTDAGDGLAGGVRDDDGVGNCLAGGDTERLARGFRHADGGVKSVDDGDVAFVIVNPLLFKPDYLVEVSEAEVSDLEIKDEKDAIWKFSGCCAYRNILSTKSLDNLLSASQTIK